MIKRTGLKFCYILVLLHTWNSCCIHNVSSSVICSVHLFVLYSSHLFICHNVLATPSRNLQAYSDYNIGNIHCYVNIIFTFRVLKHVHQITKHLLLNCNKTSFLLYTCYRSRSTDKFDFTQPRFTSVKLVNVTSVKSYRRPTAVTGYQWANASTVNNTFHSIPTNQISHFSV